MDVTKNYELKSGCLVSVKHHNTQSTFMSIVLDNTDNIIKIKLTDDFATRNLLEFDIISLGYEVKNEVYVCDCKILSISRINEYVESSIIKTVLITDKRNKERYPVSLYGDLSSKSGNDTLLIKNVSKTGMSVCSKKQYIIGDELNFTVFIDEITIYIKSRIKWKIQRQYFIEYGVILNLSIEDERSLIEYIKVLIDDQHEILNRLIGR